MINYTVEMITLIEYVKQFFKNSPVRCHLLSPTHHSQTHYKYGNIVNMTLKNNVIWYYPKNA